MVKKGAVLGHEYINLIKTLKFYITKIAKFIGVNSLISGESNLVLD